MILGNTIRITSKNLKNGYWAQNKDGYQILSPAIENSINLYCRVKDGKVLAAVEVWECPVTRQEKILAKMGDAKKVIEYFDIY